MSVIQNSLLLGDDGYLIQRSLRFRSSASAYLNRTPASAGNRKTWTWSGLVKRGALGGAAGKTLFSAYIGSGTVDTSFFSLGFNSSDQLALTGYSTNYRTSSAVYRDPSAWYHVVASIDTTQATANNRLRIYVNGSEVTAFGTTNNPVQNTDLGINQAVAHYQGWDAFSSYFDGYLTEINFIDGQALTPSSFGQTDPVTGVWQPKKYTGTYGTNGFYLPFSDNSSLANLTADKSGNGNNWTANNISLTAGVTYDSMTDVPTLTSPTVANYCVINPLSKLFGASPVLTAGNLQVSSTTGSVVGTTIAIPSTNKWYAEFTVISLSSNISVGIGNQSPSRTKYIGYVNNGNKSLSSGQTAYGATYTTNDVIGVAVDCEAQTVTFYKNNVSQGALNFSIDSVPVSDIEFEIYVGNSSDILAVNFGQRPFAYTPPSGFKALNTFNLPDATIKKGNKYMDVSLWTGNSSTQTITNSGSMQPDFVWIKSRSNGTLAHQLFDAVRGTNKALYSNLTNAEFTDTDGLTSFNSNGWTMGAEGGINGSPETFVGWSWNAGGSTVTNTSGSISSQVRANPTAGFSIVTYTGTGANATVGHGLGVASSMVIVKCRTNGVYNWSVYHRSTGATGLMILQTTNAFVSSSTTWNNTAPTSSVFTIGTDNGTNASLQNFVAYCFSEVAGFSRFGSYTGNGSADGPFVYCGFRPRYVMIKRTDVGGDNWLVLDTARNTYNAAGLELYPSASAAESANNSRLDILSNGFKIRVGSTASNYNASGGTYIYMAFAENPTKYALAR